MRGSKWDSVKPLLRTLQESFSTSIHTALLIKPDTFWQKHKTNLGSAKLSFEVWLLTFLVLLAEVSQAPTEVTLLYTEVLMLLDKVVHLLALVTQSEIEEAVLQSRSVAR